jgi:hypothetical protein
MQLLGISGSFLVLFYQSELVEYGLLLCSPGFDKLNLTTF